MREALEALTRTGREVEESFTNTIDLIYENRQELMNMNNKK